MGTTRPIKLNLVSGELELVDVPLIDEDEAVVAPAADKIPRADGTGVIAGGWLPAIPFANLPVAANGEVSEVKVVRADDARLGNPAVGGDLSGTAASATVINMQGRAISNAAPSDNYVLTWNQANNQWEPEASQSGASLTIEEQDGTPSIANVTKIKVGNDTLTNEGGGVVSIATGGGSGGTSPATSLVYYERFF